jgi:hypothetical protein
VITDRHKLHIQEHSTVLDSPEVRKDPTIIQAVTKHIQDHINLLKTTAPELLGLLGEQSLAPQTGPPTGPPPGAPPQGPGGALPPHAPPGNVMAQMHNATPPLVQEAHGVKGPKMPTLPKNTPGPAQDAYAQIQANTVK